jgi:hypothetical protein
MLKQSIRRTGSQQPTGFGVYQHPFDAQLVTSELAVRGASDPLVTRRPEMLTPALAAHNVRCTHGAT